MSIDKGNFDEVAEPDLEELINAEVSEGLRIEFKRECYGSSDSEKREFLKDVSAFSNCQGGHIVLGIEENSGIASKILGLGNIDPDAEILRLEQLTRSGLEPRISGLRMKSVPISNGGKCIVIRVPRSWNPPHRVVAQGSNRFYVRNSAGIHEPDVEELRRLFSESASALDHARNFREERLRTIVSGKGDRPLASGGRFILHVVPVAAFSGGFNVDIEEADKKQGSFWPLGSSGLLPRFNYHGFINERGGETNHGYTQVFRNGALEATKANLIKDTPYGRAIWGPTLEEQFFDVFPVYLEALKSIGVPPPLIAMITFEGVAGVVYQVADNPWNDTLPSLPEDVLFLPECIIHDYGDTVDYHRAIRPAFDALWNATGHPRSLLFNSEGLWVRPQN